MSLPSLCLDAFFAVARAGGFSSAARALGLTQSALSQRIKNLENELGLTLFIRVPSGALLTEQGERLMRYCRIRDSLEAELAGDLNLSQASRLAGSIRLAGYSSVLRSVLIPALKPLLDGQPEILCEFACRSMSELPGLLQRGEVDFIVMDYRLDKAGLQAEVLGREKYVRIEPAGRSARSGIFLDNDPGDRATEQFLGSQGGKSPGFRRSYFDDCYGIIDGVALGLGSAVMPAHLISGNGRVKVTKSARPHTREVVLHYYQQPFYSKLQRAVIDQLTKDAARYL